MATLTAQAPWPARFNAWLDERFPWKNGILFIVLYLTVATLVRSGQDEDSLAFSLFDLWGCLLTWSFFLLIRIFDEHKDYQKDCENHPHRVLQSGLITLAHLRTVGLVAVAAQGATALLLDGGVGPVTLAWLAMLGWLLLMGKEFFCGAWLEKRLPLYAISHMAIMPFIVWWLAQLAAPGAGAGPLIIRLALLALVSGFAFEITRKTWGPEEERETIDSYARIFGVRRAAGVIGALVAGMGALQGLIAWELAASSLGRGIALGVLTVIVLVALTTLAAFARAPSAAGREKNEAAVGLATLLGYLVITLTAAFNHDVVWSLV